MVVDLQFFFLYILIMSVHESYDAPKKVLEHTDIIIDALRESFFFEDYNIGEEYARKTFIGLITEIYTSNPSLDQPFFWKEDEFEVILQKIITGSIMYQLKEAGIMDSYEDENTEETFFLTSKGKQLKNNLTK